MMNEHPAGVTEYFTSSYFERSAKYFEAIAAVMQACRSLPDEAQRRILFRELQMWAALSDETRATSPARLAIVRAFAVLADDAFEYCVTSLAERIDYAVAGSHAARAGLDTLGEAIAAYYDAKQRPR